jgi:hypothetical protein
MQVVGTGHVGTPQGQIDRTLTRRAFGKQRAGRIGLASGTRKRSSVVDCNLFQMRERNHTLPRVHGPVDSGRSSLTSRSCSSGISPSRSSRAIDRKLLEACFKGKIGELGKLAWSRRQGGAMEGQVSSRRKGNASKKVGGKTRVGLLPVPNVASLSSRG